MHRSIQLLWWCLGFAIGIGIYSADLGLPTIILPFIIIGAFIYTLFRSFTMRVLALLLLGCACGMMRVTVVQQHTTAIPFDEYSTFEAVIEREPVLKQENQRVVVQAENIDGFIQLNTSLQPHFRVGDRLRIQCTLRKPESFEEFRYDKYLQRYGIVATCYYPQIEKIGFVDSPNAQLFAAKQWVVERLQHTLSAPENTIILGSVFGMNSTLPEDLEDAFRRTGTIHLLVISGSNVVVITGVLLGMMKHLPLSRRNAIIAVISVLFLYAIFTGWQPPAVRATFFGGVALLASLMGRSSQALRLLIIVATLMLLLNPLLLLYDAGFQLSFLATTGIIIFSKPLEDYLHRIPEFLGLRTATAVTLSATLTTAPLIAYSFHTFSLIALPANLVVGPLMTVIMLAGCVAIILTAVLQSSLATWILLPLYYAIHITLQIVQWFNSIPYASVDLPNFSGGLFIMLTFCIGWAAYRILQKKTI